MKLQMKTTILFFALALTGSIAQAQQLAKVPSNFDRSVWVVATENMPGPNYPRAWGELPDPCTYSHFRNDDPIQKPAQFDAAPLHVFVGNTRANANSDYNTLRTTGEGTCFGGPINRSAMYMPAMMSASGKVILPEFVDVFYRGIATTQPFPRGLKLMFGPKFMDQSYQWTAKSSRYAWSFVGPGGWWGDSIPQWIYKNFDPRQYPDYAFQNGAYRQAIRAVAPDCWDGRNLDSTDHFSHLAYSAADASVTGACPASHPVKIPQVTVTVSYNWQDRADASGWYLSSDKFQMRNDAPGTNWYVGMIPAWDDDTMDIWTTKILNAKWFGAFGKIGDGRRLEHPPTTRLFAPTADLGGRAPRFLWSLYGLFWMPGGYTEIPQQRIDPPN